MPSMQQAVMFTQAVQEQETKDSLLTLLKFRIVCEVPKDPKILKKRLHLLMNGIRRLESIMTELSKIPLIDNF